MYLCINRNNNTRKKKQHTPSVCFWVPVGQCRCLFPRSNTQTINSDKQSIYTYIWNMGCYIIHIYASGLGPFAPKRQGNTRAVRGQQRSSMHLSRASGADNDDCTHAHTIGGSRFARFDENKMRLFSAAKRYEESVYEHYYSYIALWLGGLLVAGS